jgi:DNA-binding MarR family transcriptional regulator
MASRISLRPLSATLAGGELFVGRHEELTQLESNVIAAVNTLVLAERGAGLTSFLNQAVGDLEVKDDLRVVVLSGEAARTAGDFLGAVADRLITAATADRTSATVMAPEHRDPASDTATGLMRRLDRIAQLASDLGTAVVVVIDGIGIPAVAHTVFGQLRNELWQMDQITWVLGGAASQRGRHLEPPAEAFWESVIDLPALSRNDLYTILAKRHLALSPDSRDAVIDAAAGNPMKLLLAARNAEEGRLPGQREQDPKLSEAGARLIHYLQTHGPASASDGGLLADLGLSRARAQQILGALERAGLVIGELAQTDGSPGRPRKVYRLTEDAR